MSTALARESQIGRFSGTVTRTAIAAAVGLLAVASIGCVTRTVYVTEDGSRTQAPQARVETRQAPADPYGDYNNAPAVNDVTSANEFYNPLAAYGAWSYHARFGQVFVPSVRVTGPNFRPYTKGHWEQTEWGWTFVSHEPFGWATAHYGRWFYDSRLGWAWVPGTRWSPAWVTWRTGGGYVGWAPLPPGSTYGGSYNVHRHGWIFVSYRNFGSDVVFPVMIRGSRYDDCYRRTRPYRSTVRVRGRVVYRGPDAGRVRDQGGRVVRRPIRDIDRDRPTTRPPRGVTVTRKRESDGGDHTGRAGRDRTNGRDRGDTGRDRGDTGRDRGDTGRDRGDTGRDRGDTGVDRDRGRDRAPRSGSKTIVDDRGVERRNPGIDTSRDRDPGMGDRDRGRPTTTRPGSVVIDDDRGVGRRDRPRTTPGSKVIDDDRGIGSRDRPGTTPGSKVIDDNRGVGSRDRPVPNRGSKVIDNNRGVSGRDRGAQPEGGTRAPPLGAEIPDDRNQRPYGATGSSPSRSSNRSSDRSSRRVTPDRRTTPYKRMAPQNPGVVRKPAPMTKPSRATPARKPPRKATPTRRSAPKKAAPAKSSRSKSKSKSKSKSESKKSSSKKSSRSRSRSR